jgi:hypothetical protein
MTTDRERPDAIDEYLSEMGRAEPPPTLAHDTIERLRLEPSRRSGRVRPALALVAVLAVAVVAVGVFAVAGPDLTPTTSLAPSDEASASDAPSATVSPAATAPIATPSPIAAVAPTLTWTRHELTGPSPNLETIVRFQDRFLAIVRAPAAGGDGRSMLTSEDGLQWQTLVTSPFGRDSGGLLSVAGDSLIALASRGNQTTVWKSPDGRSWELWIDVDREHRKPVRIGAVAGRWVGIPPYGPVQTSDDGATWTDATAGPTAAKPLIVEGPSGIVMPAVEDVPTDAGSVDRQSMFLTADGRTFSESILEDAGSAIVDEATADEHTYVALGSAGPPDGDPSFAAWWSDDGRTWTRASVPAYPGSPPEPVAVVPYQGGFVAAGAPTSESDQPPPIGPAIRWWSPDGRSWVVLEGGPEQTVPDPLVVDGPRLLMYHQPLDRDGPIEVWVATPAG